MAISRADHISQIGKKDLYSDFFDSFAVSPNSSQLARKTNDDSVKQSIKNLIMTEMGERPFQPKLGTSIHDILFEPSDISAAIQLQTHIEYVIKYYEPRVEKLNVSVNASEDGNYLQATIVFSIINNPTMSTVTINLKRVR